MRGCNDFVETQATLRGEGRFCNISGHVRFSPMGCGSVMQAQIHGLPECCGQDPTFFGLFVEDGCACSCNGRRIPLPTLTAYCGEALVSVYIPCLTPQQLTGRILSLTSDPCRGCGNPIACGEIRPCVKSECCCCPDPRPLFAAPIHRSPAGSTFC